MINIQHSNNIQIKIRINIRPILLQHNLFKTNPSAQT